MKARDASAGDAPVPLRDMSSFEDPSLAVAAELLRKVGPLPSSAAAEQRVLRALRDTPRSHASRRLQLGRGLRWAPVALLLVAASASAWWGGIWQPQGVSQVTEPDHLLPTASDRAVAATKPETPRPTALQAAAQQPATHKAPQPQITDISRSGPALAANKQSEATAPRETPTPIAADPAAQLMVDALQARRARRYADVGALTQQYLQKYPRGPLAEEALGLQLEAASLRGSADVRQLAQSYLQRFPNGRFRAVAERAGTETTPAP